MGEGWGGAGEPAPPYIRIEISSPPGETIQSLSFELSPLRRDPAKPGRLARAEIVQPDKDRVWLAGTVTLTEAAPGRQVTERFDFATPAGLTVNRSFKADYPKRSIVCG